MQGLPKFHTTQQNLLLFTQFFRLGGDKHSARPHTQLMNLKSNFGDDTFLPRVNTSKIQARHNQQLDKVQGFLWGLGDTVCGGSADGDDGSTPLIKRSLSMVEINELKAMHEFDDAMQELDDSTESLNGAGGMDGSSSTDMTISTTTITSDEGGDKNGDSDENFFFFDAASLSSQEDDFDDDDQKQKKVLIEEPDEETETVELQKTSTQACNSSDDCLPSVIVSSTRPSGRLGRRSNVGSHSMPPLNEHSNNDEHDDDGMGQEVPLNSTIRSLPTMQSPSSFPKRRLKRSLSQPTLQMFDPRRKPERSSLKKNRKKKTTTTTADSVASGEDDDADSTSKSLQNSVSFSSLEIRVYKLTLGDNPACSEGPPMTLDWEYHDKSEVFDVDGYESTRGPRRRKREMCMSPNLRWWRLMRENGFSSMQIQKAVADLQKAQKLRQKTVKQLKPAAKLEEALQSAKRKVTRFFHA